MEQIFQCQIELPRVLYEARRTAHGHGDQVVLLQTLFDLAARLEGSFNAWMASRQEQAPFPLRVSTQRSLRPYAYQFPNLYTLGVFGSYQASSIVLWKTIASFVPSALPRLQIQCEEAAVEISACVAQAESALLTQMSLRFWLRVGESGCKSTHTSWFRERLDHR